MNKCVSFLNLFINLLQIQDKLKGEKIEIKQQKTWEKKTAQNLNSVHTLQIFIHFSKIPKTQVFHLSINYTSGKKTLVFKLNI